MTKANTKQGLTDTLFSEGVLCKLFNNHIRFCILLLSVLLYSCKSVENKQVERISKSSFVVKSVKKMKNGVYVIYANRNDSIFKIVSYYDGKKNNGKRLVKGSYFNASLQSVFAEYERKTKIVPPCNEFTEFHGVAIGKEPNHGIDDVWFCNELNGPFLRLKIN